MTTVGQRERATQNRVVALFRDTLGYRYLGNWIDRVGAANIETELLRDWLRAQGHDEALIGRALFALDKAANDGSKSLYDRNRAVYELLRYDVKVKADAGENTQTVWLIDWKSPENNDFAIAEEVTVRGADAKANTKRPDVVLYVNGVALGVLELKRSTVSVSEGIRQNLDNQKREFIRPFFSTLQLVMAGNDTEGLRYGTIETPQKYYLSWKEEDVSPSPTPRASSLAPRPLRGSLGRCLPQTPAIHTRVGIDGYGHSQPFTDPTLASGTGAECEGGSSPSPASGRGGWGVRAALLDRHLSQLCGKARDEVKLCSGDYIDLKMYEPAMRHLIDTYIRSDESAKLSAFDDVSLIELIVERGAGAVDSLPAGIRGSESVSWAGSNAGKRRLRPNRANHGARWSAVRATTSWAGAIACGYMSTMAPPR